MAWAAARRELPWLSWAKPRLGWPVLPGRLQAPEVFSMQTLSLQPDSLSVAAQPLLTWPQAPKGKYSAVEAEEMHNSHPSFMRRPLWNQITSEL